MKNEKPLSVAEVCDIVPGDKDNPVWVNGGLTGIVAKIVERPTSKGGRMFITTLRDTTGSAEIEFSVFSPPAYGEEDIVDILGSGIRRTEYKGTQQIALSTQAKVHRMGRAVSSETPTPRAPTQAPAASPPEERGDTPPRAAAHGPVYGPRVGMALEAALGIHSTHAEFAELSTPDFWRRVHVTASDIIRVSELLERGQLAPSVRDRNAERAPPEPPPPEPPKAIPTPAKVYPPAPATLAPDDEEEIPF